MGGIVGLTVRFSEAETYRGSCHTNVLPEGLFAAPFYVDLDASREHVRVWLKMILDNRKDNPEVEELWGGHNMLAPVEYGLVIVDYVTSTLVACNGYSNPTIIYAYPGRDEDEDKHEKWCALESAGLLTELPATPSWRKARVKLPFEVFIHGSRDACDRSLQAWCEKNFGLSDGERAAWAEWCKNMEGV